jgi:hypothetical protein
MARYFDRDGKRLGDPLCHGGIRVPNGLVEDFDGRIVYVAESVS